MPSNVARFERLMYASAVIWLIAALADLGRLAQLGLILSILASNIAGVAAMVLLTWLVVRRRENWARWALLPVYVLGLFLATVWLFIAEVGDARVPRPSLFIMALIILQAVAQAAALVHLFTRDMRDWLLGSRESVPAASAQPKARYRVKAGRREVLSPEEVDHRRLVDGFVEEMEELEVGSYTAAPPNFRLLWAMGLRVPPPFFLGVVPLTLIAGIPFAVFWAVGMWLITWLIQRTLPVWLVLTVAAAVGLLVGLVMATYYRWRASALALPAWENYLPPR
jgi:hypothetical protein